MVAVGGAHGEGEPGSVVAVAVVAAHGGERELRRVSVYHDKDRVDGGRGIVIFVVAYVGAHDTRT